MIHYFGKKRAREGAIKFQVEKYVNMALLPTPPIVFGHILNSFDFQGDLGNDSCGDCLVEGSTVYVPKSSVIYRIKYCGPLVTITTASGKKLTVTPNHAVLTPRGFVCARNVQQGDDLVSTKRPEPLSPLVDNFNDSPAAIEQVFASRSRLKNHGLMGTRSIDRRTLDFHGDEVFFEGDIDVVGPNRLLHRKLYSSLGEPDTHNEIILTGKLQSPFHRIGASLQTFLRSLLPAFGRIGCQSYCLPFGFSHLGIAEPQGLSLSAQRFPSFYDLFFQMPSRQTIFQANSKQRSSSHVLADGFADISVFPLSNNAVDFSVCPFELKASVRKPTADSRPTDPQLHANLANAFPGLIKLDRVVNIDVQGNVRTHIYDLSSPARWYVAHDIISHNCVWAGAGHETMLWCHAARRPVPQFTADSIVKVYSQETGYVPGVPSTDDGTDMQQAAEFRRNSGLPDKNGNLHYVRAYATIPITNDQAMLDLIFKLAYAFGAVGCGFNMQQAQMDQFDARQPWALVPGSPIVGGHYVPVGGRNSRGNAVGISWGRATGITPQFMMSQIDEVVIYLSPEYLSINNLTPELLNVEQLTADLAQLAVPVSAV